MRAQVIRTVFGLCAALMFAVSVQAQCGDCGGCNSGSGCGTGGGVASDCGGDASGCGGGVAMTSGGGSVIMAGSGNASAYDVIIADIRLPDYSGYQLMLRLGDLMPRVPMALMTGFGYDPGHSIVKARQNGLHPKCVLFKPFRLDQLVDVVKTVLEASQADPPQPSEGEETASE